MRVMQRSAVGGGAAQVRADLDAVAPDNSVFIPTPAFWPHPAIPNSKDLAMLGVDGTTPDVPGQPATH